MKQYLRERHESERNSTMSGIVLTLAVHICAVFLVSFTGIKYLYPPPAENTFLLDFEQEEVQIDQKTGKDPRGEDVDPEEKINLVQRSESTTVSKKPNLTPATKPDTHGDVEVPTPQQEEEPQLDPRASFPGMSKKDTTLTAQHGASEAGTTFKAGQPDGNTPEGKTEGSANAHLQGRSLLGTIPKPNYGGQAEGKVVVEISVDQYGDVKEAILGAGSTINPSPEMWAEIRKAALKAHFNTKADAPALQKGTITYIFKLK